jgi:hypothetical protein
LRWSCSLVHSWRVLNDVPQSFALEANPDAVLAHVNALDQEADEAGLFAGEQLVPDAIEVSQCYPHGRRGQTGERMVPATISGARTRRRTCSITAWSTGPGLHDDGEAQPAKVAP